MFDHRTLQPVRSFRHFKQVAYSASYRHDGQLLVAGGDEPIVQLFDATNVRLDLKRCFRGHTAYVQFLFMFMFFSAIILPDNTCIYLKSLSFTVVLFQYCTV